MIFHILSLSDVPVKSAGSKKIFPLMTRNYALINTIMPSSKEIKLLTSCSPVVHNLHVRSSPTRSSTKVERVQQKAACEA